MMKKDKLGQREELSRQQKNPVNKLDGLFISVTSKVELWLQLTLLTHPEVLKG